MKRFIILLSCLFLSVPQVFSQVQVSSGNPELDVQVKRAVAEGNDVFIDLMITCYADWDVIRLIHRDRLCFFDDEGVLYHGDEYNGGIIRIFFFIDGEKNSGHALLKVARDVPRKLRILVKDVNEYAASFTYIKIPYVANDHGDEAYIVIRNLPISRD